MKDKIKKFLSFLFYSTTLYKLGQLIHGNRIIILNYHSIGKKNFERHINFLYKDNRYTVKSLDYAIRKIRDKSKIKRNIVVITFDDGYLSNYTDCFPLLHRRGFPATFYVTTANIDSGKTFWWDELKQMIYEYASPQIQFDGMFHKLGTRKEKSYFSKFLAAKIKGLSLSQRESFIDKLRLDMKSHLFDFKKLDAHRVMNWNQVKNLKKHGHTIGAHTHNHIILPNEEIGIVIDEITESKSIIEKKLGKGVFHFAYPNGNFDKVSKNTVGELGFETAVTGQFGFNGVSSDPLELRRVGISSDDDLPAFVCKVSGIWTRMLPGGR